LRHQLIYICGKITITHCLTHHDPSPWRDASPDWRVPANPRRERVNALAPWRLQDPARPCRSIAVERSKRSCHRHAATAACRSGYSVRRCRGADGPPKDGRDGLCRQAAPKQRECLHSWLSYKRLQHGRFIWPSLREPGGTVTMTRTQLARLIDGIDWRSPERIWKPSIAG
jgi:hypothetical protein